MSTSRNQHQGRYRGRSGGKHWRSQPRWLERVHAIGATPQRMPGGILALTHAYLASQLGAIDAIGDEHANNAALDVVRYVMDVMPDSPGHPLAPAFLRVVDLIEAWEKKNIVFGE